VQDSDHDSEINNKTKSVKESMLYFIHTMSTFLYFVQNQQLKQLNYVTMYTQVKRTPSRLNKYENWNRALWDQSQNDWRETTFLDLFSERTEL
jgi:hypothetical protein